LKIHPPWGWAPLREFAAAAADLAAPFFHSHMRVALRVCEKMPPGDSAYFVIQDFSEINKILFRFSATDEEANFSAAIRRSFLRRRTHAAAQKRRSEIHFSRQRTAAESPLP